MQEADRDRSESKFYNIVQHLDLTLDESEKHLADLVVKGAVWARIGKNYNR